MAAAPINKYWSLKLLVSRGPWWAGSSASRFSLPGSPCESQVDVTESTAVAVSGWRWNWT